MNVRPETVKYIEENTGIKLLAIDLRNVYVNLTPNAREAKTKTNGITSNSKTSAQQKKMVKQRQPTEWHNVFANDTSVM